MSYAIELTDGLAVTTDRSSGFDIDSRGTEAVTHAVTGTLADRIRRRLGAPESAEVKLREWRWFGGTEWTQENSTEFTVASGGKSFTFHPDSDVLDWVADATRPHIDSVYARFDAWLQVAERPAELAAEWFEHVELCNWWERWHVRSGTILDRVLRSYARRRVDHFSLERIPPQVVEDHRSSAHLSDHDLSQWRLDTVAPTDGRGFAAIENRTVLYEHSLSEQAGVIPVGVLEQVTDDWFSGKYRA